jgi:hypothetical protein
MMITVNNKQMKAKSKAKVKKRYDKNFDCHQSWMMRRMEMMKPGSNGACIKKK